MIKSLGKIAKNLFLSVLINEKGAWFENQIYRIHDWNLSLEQCKNYIFKKKYKTAQDIIRTIQKKHAKKCLWSCNSKKYFKSHYSFFQWLPNKTHIAFV